MSVPSLVVKGCGTDLNLEGQNRIAFLGLAQPLHLLPSPPNCPAPVNSRCLPNIHIRSRPSTKASEASVSPELPNISQNTEHFGRNTSLSFDKDDDSSDDDNVIRVSDILNSHNKHDVQALDSNQNNSKDNEKKRRKRKKKNENNHRKSKSKHKLKSAKGIKVSKTEEESFVFNQPVLETSFPMQAFCSPIKLSAQPKRPEKTTVNYVHVRSKSQPEKSTRQSVESTPVVTPVTVKTRNLLSASISSLSCIKASPYSVITHKQRPSVKEDVIKRITKIYLSDKHSKDLKELGMEFPGAPPATPLPDNHTEYVPSLNDIRSQRAVRLRLEALDKIEKQRQEEIRHQKLKQEKINLREQIKEKRKMQRRQIYALNAVMKQWEENNFKQFCRANGVTNVVL